jgi:pilus assembly protein CpaB
MHAKMIFTVLFLISLGVVVFLGIRALPQQGNADAAGRHEILVATTALPPSTLLRAKDVMWRSLAGTAELGEILRPADAAGNANPAVDQQARAEVYGAALRDGVAAGDPIRRSAIVRPGERDFLQIVLAPRARAIAIPVATGGASTGLLYPGDRVDVILTQTFKNDPPLTRRSVGETAVENLRVLAIDAADAKPVATSNGFGRTVTLEVTPEQAERINVAAELGKLSLTLRSIAATGAIGATAPPELAAATTVGPVWAGDVSPALGAATPPDKVVVAERPPVEVIHGTKAVAIKPQ